jgi:uncharacterized protein GlcG (DUF336 family)
MRQVPELDDAEADRVIQAALEQARQLAIKVSAALVDSGGQLKRFARMDGAEIAGVTLAPQKAFSAVANSADTDELGRQAQPGGDLYGIEAASGGAFTVVGGGVLIRSDGQIAGAVGVSGGTAAEDRACAQAAAHAWTEEGLQDEEAALPVGLDPRTASAAQPDLQDFGQPARRGAKPQVQAG